MNQRTKVFLFLVLLHLSNTWAQVNNLSISDTIDLLTDKSYEAYDDFNYRDAIKYASMLVDKGEDYNNDYYKFLGYDILGAIYGESDDTVQGRIFSEKALEIARVAGSDSLIAWGTMNLAIIYSENPKTLPKAIRFFKESIAVNEKNNASVKNYLAYINLAWTYLENGQIEEASDTLKKAREISKTQQIDSEDKLYEELLFARYYLGKKKYTQAKIELNSVAKKADKDSVVDVALEAYENLTLVYEQTDDFKNAFESLKKYNHYNNKAIAKKRIQETAKAKASFNIKRAKKDLELAIKEKEYSQELVSKSRLLNIILVISTLILAIALIIYLLFLKTRKKYIAQLKTNNKELKIAKEKAEELSLAKSKFLATVSHELRTPLYGVIGIATLLKDDENLKSYQDDLESLKFSAGYLLALINDFLMLNKVDAEVVKLSQIPYQLDSLVEKIIKSFEFTLKQNSNTFHVHIDENIPNSLSGDPMRLSQILMNLIGNAIKFTTKGNIWLNICLMEIDERGRYKTRFTVKDDGLGISPEEQKIIFDEFIQIDSKNHDYKGTGLGLTIVKKLLTLFDSHITLESESGKGSEFSFLLYLEKNKEPTLALAAENNMSEVYLQRGGHALVVDDNRINQKVTKKILKKYGIQSSLASDGRQAIEMVLNNNYDIVFMDINMPNVDGMSATREIRKFNKEIPIIALTAVELDEMKTKILDSGINHILHKPYLMREFLDTIQQYMPLKQI
ncbi:hybrid sensor histidine kinase/response regulator [Pareuzebyella sediminis]|uniref:hybrid sensor histidine kinase/response regulator n=1 Tax=Pareuzebyella sediminis TaxID=2607998 RepID=UPI0011ED3E7D|nr:response regulator [Pareuzebyella sediminis]